MRLITRDWPMSKYLHVCLCRPFRARKSTANLPPLTVAPGVAAGPQGVATIPQGVPAGPQGVALGWFVAPLRGLKHTSRRDHSPGRCPGLVCCALSGLGPANTPDPLLAACPCCINDNVANGRRLDALSPPVFVKKIPPPGVGRGYCGRTRIPAPWT